MQMLSTSSLGRVIGVKAKPLLFCELQRLGYLAKINNRYVLTPLGESAELGGCYGRSADGKAFVTWPLHVGDKLLYVKENMLSDMKFRLFHMSHIDNVASIMKHGIFSHNSAPDYTDISNPKVNSIRKRIDPIHKFPLHEYVPFYFNPRNAMLYEKQAEYAENLIILEARRRICLSHYTIFSERNAATEACRFVYCLSDLAEFDWKAIYSQSWSSRGICSIDTKQLMMSECLVRHHVATEDLLWAHTMNRSAACKLASLVDGGSQARIRCSPELYFR